MPLLRRRLWDAGGIGAITVKKNPTMYKSNWIPAILTLIMVCLVSYALLVNDQPGCKQKQLAAVVQAHSFMDYGMGHGMYHLSEVDHASGSDDGC